MCVDRDDLTYTLDITKGFWKLKKVEELKYMDIYYGVRYKLPIFKTLNFQSA